MRVIRNVKYNISENYCIVGDNSTTYGNGITDKNYDGKIVIEDRVNRLKVQEIGRNAFRECHKITEVIIYAKIKSINCNAFDQCISLRYINIPSTVTYIGDVAFYLGNGNCRTLSTEVIFEFNLGRTQNLFIGKTCFTYRSKIYIIYPYNFSPECDTQRAFEGSPDVIICAASVMNFYTKTTKDDYSLCPTPKYKERPGHYNTISYYEMHIHIILSSLTIIIFVSPK